MNKISQVMVGCAAALALFGCGGKGNGIINVPNPRVRVANVMPGIATAKAKVGDDTISSSIAFGAVSDYTVTGNGNKDLSVGDSTFSNLATLPNQLFETQRRYTGIAYGSSTRAIILLDEDKSAGPSNAVAFQIVHAAQGASNVDVYLSAPGDPLPASPSFANVAAGSISDFSEFGISGSPANVRIRVFAAGTTVNPIVDTNLAFEEKSRHAIVIYSDSGQTSGFNVLTLKENV
jgi:hypothetical protein